jgi:probable HAF family extracellular repeat protein
MPLAFVRMNIPSLLIALFASTACLQAVTPTYSVTALPNIQGVTRPDVIGINDQSTVIGLNLDNVDTSFMYSHGKYTFIEPSTTASNNVEAINNFNVIVGPVSTGQKFIGYIYNRGKIVTFEPAAGALETLPSSINDLGQIVGYFSPAGVELNLNDHVFIRQINGTFIDLGAFGTDPYALINIQGTVVINALNGPATSSLTITNCYIRQPGSPQLQKVPSLVPGASVDAQSINQFGVIGGAAFIDTSNYIEHAFLYANGKISDLGVLPPTGVNPGERFSWFNSVNIRGIAVGLAGQEVTNRVDPSNPQKESFNLGYDNGIVCYNGVIHDLNSMLSTSASGWVIGEAVSINDQGQIAALASYKGANQTSVILTPNGILP